MRLSLQQMRQILVVPLISRSSHYIFPTAVSHESSSMQYVRIILNECICYLDSGVCNRLCLWLCGGIFKIKETVIKQFTFYSEVSFPLVHQIGATVLLSILIEHKQECLDSCVGRQLPSLRSVCLYFL